MDWKDPDAPSVIENCKRFLLEMIELKTDVNTNHVF